MAWSERNTQRLKSNGNDFAVAIGSGGPASFTAEFLLQDGPSGTPGTVIWTSPVQLISDSTYYSRKVWDISVPSIVVPDTFVWAVSVIQRNNNGLLESAFETASVGIANKVYFLDPTSGQWTVPFATLFAARVTAIPEPSTLALLGLGSLGLLVGSAFRHTTLRSGKLSCAHSDQNKLSRL